MCMGYHGRTTSIVVFFGLHFQPKETNLEGKRHCLVFINLYILPLKIRPVHVAQDNWKFIEFSSIYAGQFGTAHLKAPA